MQTWRFIDSGPCDAAYNMALDEAIAVSVREGVSPTTLRLYGWEAGAVSIGSFQKLPDVNLEYCRRSGIPIVRRPTGGRGILHGDELTYSFSAKNEGPFAKGLLDAYRHLNTAFKAGLAMIGLEVTMKAERESGRNLTRSPLCFQSASYGEISCQGRKLAGSAQKRWRDGFLQQGSLPYSVDYERLGTVFNVSNKLRVTSNELKEKNSGDSSLVTCHPSLPFKMVGLRELLSDFDPEEFRRCVRLAFEQIFAVSLAGSPPSPREEELARLLAAEKYRNPRWTEGA